MSNPFRFTKSRRGINRPRYFEVPPPITKSLFMEHYYPLAVSNGWIVPACEPPKILQLLLTTNGDHILASDYGKGSTISVNVPTEAPEYVRINPIITQGNTYTFAHDVAVAEGSTVTFESSGHCDYQSYQLQTNDRVYTFNGDYAVANGSTITFTGTDPDDECDYQHQDIHTYVTTYSFPMDIALAEGSTITFHPPTSTSTQNCTYQQIQEQSTGSTYTFAHDVAVAQGSTITFTGNQCQYQVQTLTFSQENNTISENIALAAGSTIKFSPHSFRTPIIAVSIAPSLDTCDQVFKTADFSYHNKQDLPVGANSALILFKRHVYSTEVYYTAIFCLTQTATTFQLSDDAFAYNVKYTDPIKSDYTLYLKLWTTSSSQNLVLANYLSCTIRAPNVSAQSELGVNSRVFQLPFPSA